MTPADFCPYVGLRPFTASERAYFFGRERDERVIAANMFAAPLTVLYGPSAVGKSSVLQAGVVPHALAEPRTAVVYFASWQDPSYRVRLRSECARALHAANGGAIDIDPNLPLDETLGQAAQKFRGTLLLILDQFEEYLLYYAETSEFSFDEELARIVNRHDVPANILLGIREDGLAKLDRFRKRIPNLLGNTLRLRRLSPEAAREAIVGPVDVYNREGRGDAPPMDIEPQLVDAVIDEVRASRVQASASGGTGAARTAEDGDLIETALLQMVMTRLWSGARLAGGRRRMEKAALDALGGARNVVKLHLYDTLGQLPPDGRAVAADLFQQLVTPSGAKVAHTTDDLVSFAKQPAARVIPVLEHLTQARLLRRVDPPERYEIFHDALANAILDWRTEYMREVARRTAVKEAAVRRNRRLAAAMALIVVAAVGAYGWSERREAERQRLTSDVLGARAQRSEQLLAAATKAQEAAEKSREEAEATATKAQLQVAIVTASTAGQTTRVAALKKEEAAADAKIAQARKGADEATSQSKANLNAADETQKRIDALNRQLSDPVEKPVVPPTPPTAIEAVTPPAPPPDAAPAPVVQPPPPTPPAPAPTPQGDYKAIYRQAINARDRKRWSDAVQLFQNAAQLKPDTGETITMPGFGDDQPYLPYFNLGVARQNLKDCPGAIEAWKSAEQAGAILKSTKDLAALRQRQRDCAK